jgi:2-polyprenyl-6-hydroxyphenyl methylase/3-demethylubiquinone-9 3-methyltransferase
MVRKKHPPVARMCSVQSVGPEISVRIDNRLYDEVGDSWWRADSLLYQLKASLNPVRLAYARRKLFDELRLEPRGKQALEVGCGGGLVCEEIARLGFEVTGIDPSEPSLAAADLHARSSGLAIHYEQAWGESLPFSEGSFDVVFCLDVLEHVRDLPQVIREVARVLKPGGVFCYDTLNRTWLSYLVAIKIGQEWPRWAFLPPNLHVWEMFIKPLELKVLLAKNQLDWRDHRGLKPNVSVLTALRILRRRAAGECSYAELGERIQLVESRLQAVLYLGYAVKL